MAGQTASLKSLREAFWLVREAGSGTRETTDQLLLPHLRSHRRSIELGSSETIKRAVVEGLGNDTMPAKAALLGQGAITLSELDAFVANEVKRLTNGQQSPVLMNPKGVPNFPVALVQ